jgi:hypothetical protein
MHSKADQKQIVQIRVMPKCWFVLLRFWLRVDNTLVRLRETRFFCSTATPQEVLREIKHCEGTFAELQAAGAPASNVRPHPLRIHARVQCQTYCLDPLPILPEIHSSKCCAASDLRSGGTLSLCALVQVGRIAFRARFPCLSFSRTPPIPEHLS